MPFKAILTIEGKKYNLLQVSYDFTRSIGESGIGGDLIRLNQIKFLIAAKADVFFLDWMFTPELQKSGSISFYDDEDLIKKVKQVVFAGAFCMRYEEKFSSMSSIPLYTYVSLAAGGIKISESTFRFPWFKGPLEAPAAEVAETEVEYAAPGVTPKPAAKPAAAAPVIKTSYAGFGGDIILDPTKTTTVIGKFDDQVNGLGTKEILKMPEGSFTRGGENLGGINILDIPSDVYAKLLLDYGEEAGKEMFWEDHNQPFLEKSFQSGDNIRVLSDPNAPANRTGFYARELNEIEGTVDAKGNKKIGLAEKYGYKYNASTSTYEKQKKK